MAALAHHCSISLGDNGEESVLSFCSRQLHPPHMGSEDLEGTPGAGPPLENQS